MLASDTSSKDSFASFDVPVWAWAALVGAIVVMLVADLLLVHRTAHVITIKEASIESAVWISIGLLFGVFMLVWQGGQAGGEYFAGFLIEKSLSIDNVFVWAVILSFFRVPAAYQFRVLFWGIFGALVLRAIFIFAGVSLIESFERSEEHTSELQSLMRISYAVFCLKKKKKIKTTHTMNVSTRIQHR